ncbi:hypothetical protein NM688_g2301 [Phlebia brevispora]|uniref:Uncharacterized protein n=1 Tax=Phlebia brevispora TaxID=194682 RepID=A0ACC1T989_9APHY|nr:hypothetical protein NM688_g2301 [Phlebia brevispora]
MSLGPKRYSRSPQIESRDTTLAEETSVKRKSPSDATEKWVDDEEWEDEPEINLARPYEKSPGSPAFAGRVRKRKGGKVMFVAQPNGSRKYPSPRTKVLEEENARPLFEVTGTHLRGAFQAGASYTAEYTFDVVKSALRLLRKPLSLTLSLILFLYLFSLLLSQAHSTLRTMLSPLCWIPGIAQTPMCAIPAHAPKVPKWADYPKLVEVQGSRFEQLLDDSIGNSGISLDIKRAEMATTDLITLVKVSDLKTKETLATHLEGFVEDAKRAGRGLQRLSSRIGGAVDNIIAINDYALHTIEGAQAKPNSLLSVLWPFGSDMATVQEVVRDTFTQTMSVLETQMRRIVLEAEVSMHALTDLEERLVTLHEIVVRENNTLIDERADLLAQLWTIVGGNKKKLKHMNGHLFLLGSIGEYRKRAIAHVSAALQTLQGMSEDMEDLRQRVAAPELIGDRIPIAVHIKSIRAGLERRTS